ncbi:MAG: hypothetical protein K2L08_03925, partial [Erysipelotrichaceae bacterium]|nr:hypothetical protein [Erysipelotrichaceae bacterium]
YIMKKECVYQIARYGKWFSIFFFAFLCSTFLFQIIRAQIIENYVLRYSYGELLIFSAITCTFLLFFYFLEKHYKYKIYHQKVTQLLDTFHYQESDDAVQDIEESVENLQSQDNPFDYSWAMIGLKMCIYVAQENLQMFCDHKKKEIKKQEEGVELFIFEKLIDRLLEDVQEHSLLGMDIRLTMNRLESILDAYKKHDYDSYIEQLDIEEQLHIQLLLCDESFMLIKETMKERFDYLPSTFMDDLEQTLTILEQEIEKENPYAQYDFANICFSSNHYKAMDFAIDLLYKAQDSHKGAKEYIERLRNA